MEGQIIIRGMTDEEIREAAGAGAPPYSSAIAISTRCRISRSEKVQLIYSLMKGLRFDALDRAMLLRMTISEGRDLPIGMSRLDEFFVDLRGEEAGAHG